MRRSLGLWLIIGLAILVAGVLANGARQAARVTFVDEPPAAREARLAADWRLVRPEGPGPHKAAIVLSGCDGVHDNMDFWAGVFADTGRAALIVDSHRPRGLDRAEAWRLVCAGQALTGAERAGDIAVAMDALSRMDGIDASDVVIFGASHGGWTAMEFVATAKNGTVPPGLTGWPAPPADLLSRVSGVVLLYPYCGVLNGAETAGWQATPPALMILGGKDSIVSTPACLDRAGRLQGAGAAIETLVLPDADHGFDQQERSALSSLRFEPALRDVAETRVRDFLAALPPR